MSDVFVLLLWDGDGQGHHDVLAAFDSEERAEEAAEEYDTFGHVHVESVPLNPEEIGS